MKAVAPALIGFPPDALRQDATLRLPVFFRASHCRRAVKGDPRNCVVSLATRDATGASRSLTYPSVVNLFWDDGDAPEFGPNGEDVILRYLPDAGLRRIIKVLDEGGDRSLLQPGVYNLLPPPPGQRLGLDRSPKGPSRAPHAKHRPHQPLSDRWRFDFTAGVEPDAA